MLLENLDHDPPVAAAAFYGVVAGNRFEIYREPRVRYYYEGQVTSVGEELVRSAMTEPVGELLVLSVEKETAAAIITKTKIELYPGERVRMKTHR